MNEQFLSEVFFPIVRAGLGLPVENAPQKIDFPLLIETAKKQSVLPVIYEGLSNLKITGSGFDSVKQLCMNDMFLFAQRDLALEKICDCFEKSGIKYVLLKGSVLRDLYPDPWMRTSCDVDVLIEENDLDRAVRELRDKVGFEYKYRLYHDVSMTLSDVSLELHFSLKEDVEGIDRILSEAWDHAALKSGSEQYVFSPEFQIFHVIAHMSYHFIRSGFGIRSYLDLWLLKHRTRFDENSVRDMCERAGILKFYEQCSRLSEVWLGKEEHSETTRALERFSFEGGALGSAKNASLSVRRNNRGIKYFLARLFVDRKKLEILYPNLKKHPVLLPYYQVKRWILALVYKSGKIKNELTIYNETGEKDINAMDELYKSVGLEKMVK